MELIATRDALVGEIARIFRIPAHLLGIKGDGQTYANVEQASLNFLVHTVGPWIRRIETALSRLLPDGTSCSFDTTALLRSDALTRHRIYQLAIASGILSPNEARSLEGLAPYDGGNAYVQACPGRALAGGELPDLGNQAPSTSLVGVQD